MELAFGWLGWTPVEFWRATPTEFQAALRGFAERNGAAPKPPSVDEVRSQFASAATRRVLGGPEREAALRRLLAKKKKREDTR